MEPATGVKAEEALQLSDRVNRISVSPTMVVLQAAEAAESQGRRRRRLRRGRARFPHAGAHQARRDPGAGRKPHEVHAHAGHCRRCARRSANGTRGIWARPISRRNASSTSAASILFSTPFAALINPGDEVMIAAPYWVSYPDIVKYAGGTPVIRGDAREADNFVLRAAAVEKLITPRTRMVICRFAEQSYGRRDSAGRVRENSGAFASGTASGCWPTSATRISRTAMPSHFRSPACRDRRTR